METRNLDVTLLRTFVAAAERENFGHAAEKVFRTQAAVSQQMQRLESLVGCELFTRVGRNKRLTDQGVRLLEYARRILNLNDEAYRAMTQEVFEYPVKIAACVDAVDTLLPEYLARCVEGLPGPARGHPGRTQPLAGFGTAARGRGPDAGRGGP